jgi:REP element-mobilizing transposase RayT
MPRHARIDIPGLLQHVIVRGIDRSPIFLDDQDREDFLQRFRLLLQETETDCYAWALLDNHFHLLLRPRSRTIGNLMRRLLTGYAVVFNLRHNRSGHLFQNRFKSIVCDEEPYLQELLRYIHLNPLRAGMVPDLSSLDVYPWCGHSELVGKKTRSIIKIDEVLALFDCARNKACKRYRSFLEDGCPPGRFSRGGKQPSLALNPDLGEDLLFDERILGGGSFVEILLEGEGHRPSQELPTFDDVSSIVCAHYQVVPSVLSRPSKERRITRAKAVICFLTVRHFRMKGVEVAAKLGFSSTAVAHATKRGELFFAEDSTLRNALKQKL